MKKSTPQALAKILLFVIGFLLLGLIIANAQMKREVKNYKGVNYLQYTPNGTPQGVVFFLHGLGERGSDITLLERLEIPLQLKNGLEVPYIVIAPQLPSSFTGWYGNVTYPIIELCQSFKLPIHITGLSLGGMIVPTLVKEKPVFATAATVCGYVLGEIKTQIFAEMQKIPSIHYYDPGDARIAYGYLSVLEMYNVLKSRDADITLVTWPGKGHNIWDESYTPAQYWAWLASKVSPVQPVHDPVIEIWLDEAGKLNYKTQSGKIIQQ